MISIKNKEEIAKMRSAGKLAGKTLSFIEPFIKAGISTEELNKLCHNFIVEHNAIPAPLNYSGFPKSICTSVNNVVCHGIPSEKEILKDGDIVNIDVTVILNGYHGDTSRTYFIGDVSEEVVKLVSRTEKAMMKGIEAVKPGGFLSEVGKAIEKYIKKYNYSIVSEYGGHGIGKKFHEDPHVYHFYTKLNKIRLKPGMTFTVEPMINLGSTGNITTSEVDGWTVTTNDNLPSAQFEHTILVTDKGYEILTLDV